MSQAQFIQANGTCTHPTKKTAATQKFSLKEMQKQTWATLWCGSYHVEFPCIVGLYILVSVSFGCGCECRALMVHLFPLKYGELTILV